jgi:hypothetical protein
VPAAAVIPAPVAYIKVVAVKKLVVGFLVCCARSACFMQCVYWSAVAILLENVSTLHWVGFAI